MQPDFGWLKRFMPRGLYGRAALILFLPVVVVTLVVTVMFLQRHFEGVTRQMSRSMAFAVDLIDARIDAAPTLAGAKAVGVELGAPLGIGVDFPGPAVPEGRRIYDLSGRVVAAEMMAALPHLSAINLTDLKQVQIGMDSVWGPYVMTFDRSRVSASNPHQLLVLMAGTSLLMTTIASLFLRNQLRPIRRLARAAEDYGKGRVTPYRPAGASEVRSAGKAFVDMRNRIERQADQRRMMLSGISHDLRTPLTRLQLSLSMLGPDFPPDEDDITAMLGDVQQMSQMVEAFMDFARDTANDGPPESLQVVPFLSGILADAHRAGQKVDLVRVDGDAEAYVTFRPDLLRRALENLLGNARRYGNLAQVEVMIGPRSVRIAIEDDGPGISHDQFDDAQRPFVRLDPGRSQNKGEGVGLGLSIAADVARAHGGSLQLRRGDDLGGLRAEIVIAR